MDTSDTAGRTGTVYTAPAGAVRIEAGQSIQAAINAHPAGTNFILGAGTHYASDIRPKNGNGFYGENGQTVLDGNGAAKAFSGQGVSDVTVAGLTITDYAPPTQGIGVFGTDGSSAGWRILGNEITDIARGTAIMLGTDMEVRDNEIHDNYWTGIGSWNVSGAVIENNDIYRNNLSGQSPFSATGDGAGIKITQTTDTLIAGNHVYDNIGPGIWTDINTDDNVIEENWVEGNAAGGVFIELDYGSIVRNNLIQDNNDPFFGGFRGGGVYVFNAQNAVVSGNTIEGNGGGVWVYEEGRGSGNQGAWVTQNVTVSDNLIVMDKGHNGIGGTATGDGSIRFEGNDYWLSGDATMVYGSAVSTSEWQSRGLDTAALGSTFSNGTPPSRPAPDVPQEPAPQEPAPELPEPEEPAPQEPTPELPEPEEPAPAPAGEVLNGTGRDDVLRGGEGNDTLRGGKGDDFLFGGPGDDVLRGGPGDDILMGGPGRDVFLFGRGDGSDWVVDFTSGEDRIRLVGIDAEEVSHRTEARWGMDGLILDLGQGDEIFLQGVSELADRDVVFA